MDEGSNLNTFLNGFKVGAEPDVCFHRESTSSGGVAIGNEVVHDQVIDVTNLLISKCAGQNVCQRRIETVFASNQIDKSMFFSSRFFREIPNLS